MNWTLTGLAFAQEAAATAAQPKPSIVEMLILPVGLMVVLYLFTIRPQQKRAKDHADLVKNLKPGDEVVTSGGILGRVRKIEEGYVSLEISANSIVKVMKNSVTATTKPNEKAAPAVAAKDAPVKA